MKLKNLDEENKIKIFVSSTWNTYYRLSQKQDDFLINFSCFWIALLVIIRLIEKASSLEQIFFVLAVSFFSCCALAVGFLSYLTQKIFLGHVLNFMDAQHLKVLKAQSLAKKIDILAKALLLAGIAATAIFGLLKLF